jgi:hypothetical protein
MKISHGFLFFALMLGSAACAEGQLRLTKAERIAELRKANPCEKRPFTVDILGRSHFEADACALVTLALRRVAAGDGKAFGVRPADTARVTAATALDTRDGTDRQDGQWLVGVQVSGRRTSLTMSVDQQTGRMTFKDDHPLQPIRKP